MSKLNIRPFATIAAAASLVSIALLGFAMAEEPAKPGKHPSEPRYLSGTYGFSVTQACARAPFLPSPEKGFDPVTKQRLVDGEFSNGIGTGVMRFERGGIATIENGLITEISATLTSAGQTPASVGTRFGCVGTYTLSNDNKIAVSLSCETFPPPPGLRVITEPVEFEGFLSSTRTINLGTYKSALQSITVYDGTTPVQQRQRICLQTLNLDRI